MFARMFFTPIRMAFFGGLALFGYLAWRKDEPETKSAPYTPPPKVPAGTFNPSDMSKLGCENAFASLSPEQQQHISDTILDAATAQDPNLLYTLADEYETATMKGVIDSEQGMQVSNCIRTIADAMQKKAVNDVISDAQKAVESALNTMPR